MQVDLLNQGRLPPSGCTWHLLERAGYVGRTKDFLYRIGEVREPLERSTDSTTDTEAAASMIQIIQDTIVPTNEGYPQLICETIMAQTVHNLNRRAGRKEYYVLIKPVVKEESDSRQKKCSDVGLQRVLLFNERTYVILECKASVGAMVTGGDTFMNDVSQLFLEAIYMHTEENAQLRPPKQYHFIVCILTDATSWHFFLLNLRGKPITIHKYIKLSEETTAVTVKTVVDLLCTFVPAQCS